VSRILQHGELVEVDGRWHVCTSIPHFWGGERVYLWRDGSRRVIPELIDPEHERRVREGPPPPPPDDPLARYLVVRARS
jgi:hypothetical protein